MVAIVFISGTFINFRACFIFIAQITNTVVTGIKVLTYAFLRTYIPDNAFVNIDTGIVIAGNFFLESFAATTGISANRVLTLQLATKSYVHVTLVHVSTFGKV